VLAAARPNRSPIVDPTKSTKTGQAVSGPSVMVNGGSNVAMFNANASAQTEATPESAWVSF